MILNALLIDCHHVAIKHYTIVTIVFLLSRNFEKLLTPWNKPSLFVGSMPITKMEL
jgi:hypothetical protein